MATNSGPLVSILIPVHNRCDLTQVCLESLFAHADPSVSTEIILIDDCSTDETPAYLVGLGDAIRVIRNETRQCFGRNMNQAARAAQGKYLCLLNNDTYVTPGWLKTLVDVLEDDPTIGVVGNKHLFPATGKLNHAGMVFDAQSYPWHLYPGYDADLPCANVSREFQALTAACWLVPRQFFLFLGGFDENYRNGFEDVDFCLRTRKLNRKVHYCARSVIYHHGQSSPGRTDNDKVNWEYFQKQWAGAVVADREKTLFHDGMLDVPLPFTPLPPVIRAQSADVHLAVPLEAMTSFSWLTSQLALALEDIGVTVSMLPGPIHSSMGETAIPRLEAMMARPQSKFAHIKWNHYWEPFVNQGLTGEINAEFFVTNYRYGRRSLHELDRWMRHVVMSANRKLPDSQYCCDALTELGVAPERCAVVSHGFAPEVLTAEGQDDRFRCYGTVFLAIVNSHDVYRIGTDILLQAYDRAFTASDDVVLVLKDYGIDAAGSRLAQWLKARRGGARVIHLCEFVEKDALIRLYRGADYCVAPFRGEGFGTKLLDAAATGTPILAPGYGGPADFLTPGGYFPLAYRTVPVGECLDREVGIVPQFAQWIECDVDDLARQFREAARDKVEGRRRAKIAQEFVLNNFSWKNAALRLQEVLDRFGRERSTIVNARRLQGPPAKRLSIVMPTYNRPDTVGRCLDAYRQQTLDPRHWELVLVDDKSNYSVADVVKERGAGLPVRLVVNEVNCGQGQCRNRVLPQTQGEIIVFSGDDIIPEKHFLEEHLKAHDSHGGEQLAVLGHVYWHPEVHVTPMMAYTTGEGGQQFYYHSLAPGQYVTHFYFYTSNVSLKRSFLIEQEEWFSPRFVCYGYEDVELAMRLSRAGMHMVYQPKARAGHLHALTDQNIIDRQYKAGRMTLTFLLLHPDICPPDHLTFIQWLDITQHLLLHDQAFLGLRDDLARYSQSLRNWLDCLFTVTEQFNLALNPDRFEQAQAAPHVQREGAQRLRLRHMLYGYRLNLALRSGMADQWFGVKAEDPNPARDLFHLLLCTSYWDLFRNAQTRGPDAPPMSPAAGRMLEIARNLRRHPWLMPIWNSVKDLPGVRTLKGATKRMLHSLP